MKMIKSMVLLVCLVMMSSLVFAAGQGVHEPGTGIEDPELKDANQGTGQGQDVATTSQTMNKGDSQQLQNKEEVKTQLNELKQSMQQKQQQLNSESEGAGSGEKVQQMMMNQNQVRVAAQTLSQMKEMLGNKGEQISTIAKEFDNSVQSTIKSEEKIQTRSVFSRFFAGGDKKAAEEIESQVTKNQKRIKELKQLKEQADCDEETKVMMQEQIQQMEQEQTRLNDLAQKEKKSKGMFGWIWK